jgi:hypothetical protein
MSDECTCSNYLIAADACGLMIKASISFLSARDKIEVLTFLFGRFDIFQ